MDVLSQFLDAREAENEPRVNWVPLTLSPEERLTRFDLWLYRKLAEKLDWTWAGDQVAQGRRINQARFHVEQLVLGLWRRGWLLDGSRLAAHIQKPLNVIAKYQSEGKIEEFWPYFKATISRYVGVNSEEIQRESLQIGSSISQLLGPLGIGKGAKPRSLPELLAARAEEVARAQEVSLREKQARLRAKERESGNLDAQLPLFD